MSTHEHFHFQSFPASQRWVDKAVNDLTRELDDGFEHDGWSKWVWVRTASGDLMLATFPCGDTYMELEEAVDADYVAAEHTGNVPGGLRTTNAEYDGDV